MSRKRGLSVQRCVVLLAAALMWTAGAGVRVCEAEVLAIQEDGLPMWDEVVFGRSEIITTGLDGSDRRVILTDSEASLHTPQFSPDGQQLAFWRDASTGREICVYDLDGIFCVAFPGVSYGYTWHADSHTIYYGRNQGDGQVWRIDLGATFPVAESFYDPPVYRTFGLSISADGLKMVMAQDPSNNTWRNYLSVYDFDTGHETVIYPNNRKGQFYPSYSPARDEITWGLKSGSNTDIWIGNDDGTGARNLTPGTSDVTCTLSVFGPDGEWVYYRRGRYPGAFDLWAVRRDGSSDGMLFRLCEAGDQILSFDVGVPVWANQPPVADAGLDQELDADADCEAIVQLDGSGSFDPDDDPLSYLWEHEAFGSLTGVSPSVNLAPGYYDITLTVDDSKGGAGTDTVFVAVEDHMPPDVHEAAATPDVLWPPNHKMRPVEITLQATDNCSQGAPSCRITGVTSSEPVSGARWGNTSPDWEITGDLTLLLRAERVGHEAGRVYSVEVTCTDGASNSASVIVEVAVTHDQGS